LAAEMEAAGSIADPLERARVLTDLLAAHRTAGDAMAAMRRDAINAALAAGVTRDQVASALGVSGPRISQMRRVADPEPSPAVVTGWQGKDPAPVAAIAITGSRGGDTDAEAISAAALALAGLLLRRAYSLSHGPVGVGAEVITYIADTHSPDGLDHVRGVLGHDNVVKDADYVLIVGGGKGTLIEADTALAAGKRVLPMPATGGTAAEIYMRQLRNPQLRAWLTDTDFSALATATGQQFADIAERLTTSGGSDE
jgi:hypothetical protein